MMKKSKNLMLASMFGVAAVALIAITSSLSFGKSLTVNDSYSSTQDNPSNVIDANSWQVTGSGAPIQKTTTIAGYPPP